MTGLIGRIGAFFFEPAEASQGRAAPPSLGSGAVEPGPGAAAGPSADRFAVERGPGAAAGPSADRFAVEAGPGGAAGPSADPLGSDAAHVGSPAAAVLGAPAAVVPVAAACAGELRARERAAAALICIWRPLGPPPPEPEAPAAQSPAGATTPGARRLAARLVARELPATACGRLAWLALDADPELAAGQFRRCRAAAGTALVLAVAGPRPPALEPLLADLDLGVAVLGSDTGPPLRALALARLPGRTRLILPPLPPGPPRWAAMAGLARLRSLPELAP